MGLIVSFSEGIKEGIVLIFFVVMILAFSGAWHFSTDVFAGPPAIIDSIVNDGDSVKVKWIDESRQTAVVQLINSDKKDFFIKVNEDMKLDIKEPGTYLVKKNALYDYSFIKIDVKQSPEVTPTPTQ